MNINLVEESKKIGVILNDDMVTNFMQYKTLLKEWNEKINLTAIVDDNEILVKHFIDSLTIERYIEKDAKVIDVGTGAGFPGVPLKIARKDISVTLLDSLRKRLDFLKAVIEKLNLNEIESIHGRAEEYGNNKIYREKYDVVVSRAVANLSVLCEYCLPFLKVGGTFICMKGSNIDEIDSAKNAVKKLGGEIIQIDKICLPSTEIERNIILIKKIKNTPNGFPRKSGVPSKKPIK